MSKKAVKPGPEPPPTPTPETFKATWRWRGSSASAIAENICAQHEGHLKYLEARCKNYEIYLQVLLRRLGFDPTTRKADDPPIAVEFSREDIVSATPQFRFSTTINHETGAATLHLNVPKQLAATVAVATQWALAE